jgi:hypothetical protein
LQPGARPEFNAEGDDQDLHVQPAQLSLEVTQLRHMIAAGQSAQVAQKDQQRRPTAAIA